MDSHKYPKPGTQKAVVLDLLLAANGKPVSVRDMAIKAHSAAPHSVIADIRKYGWKIKNRMFKRKLEDGRFIQCSEYWIITKEEACQ